MKAERITATSTPQKLNIGSNGGVGLTVLNEGPAIVFVGGSDVDASTKGLPLIATAGWGENLRANDEVWVMCETTSLVAYIATGV